MHAAAEPVGRQRREVELPAVVVGQGDGIRDPAGEQRSRVRRRGSRGRPRARPARSVGVQHREREVEDRLLAAGRRQHVPVRVDLDPVSRAWTHPATASRRSRLAGGGRVAGHGPDGVTERLADERRRRLVGVTDGEVGQRPAVRPEVVGEVLEPSERVAAQLGERGVRGHHARQPTPADPASGRGHGPRGCPRVGSRRWTTNRARPPRGRADHPRALHGARPPGHHHGPPRRPRQGRGRALRHGAGRRPRTSDARPPHRDLRRGRRPQGAAVPRLGARPAARVRGHRVRPLRGGAADGRW
jgi:hypothetical protein